MNIFKSDKPKTCDEMLALANDLIIAQKKSLDEGARLLRAAKRLIEKLREENRQMREDINRTYDANNGG